MKEPVLETPRLILRPYKLTDADAHERYINDWEVARYLNPKFPWPYPKGNSAKYIKKSMESTDTNLRWVITIKDRGDLSDELVGSVELRPDDNDGQRGFWLARDFQNNGYMTEAIYKTNDYWFNELNKDKMLVCNATTNASSSRLKNKTGARLVRTYEDQFLDPAFTHAEEWELTKENWEKFKQDNKIQP